MPYIPDDTDKPVVGPTHMTTPPVRIPGAQGDQAMTQEKEPAPSIYLLQMCAPGIYRLTALDGSRSVVCHGATELEAAMGSTSDQSKYTGESFEETQLRLAGYDTAEKVRALEGRP